MELSKDFKKTLLLSASALMLLSAGGASVSNIANASHVHHNKVTLVHKISGTKAKQMYSTLLHHGYSKNQALVIMADAIQESGLKLHNDNYFGFGPGAVSGNKLNSFKKYAKRFHKNPKSILTQLQFMQIQNGNHNFKKYHNKSLYKLYKWFFIKNEDAIMPYSRTDVNNFLNIAKHEIGLNYHTKNKHHAKTMNLSKNVGFTHAEHEYKLYESHKDSKLDKVVNRYEHEVRTKNPKAYKHVPAKYNLAVTDIEAFRRANQQMPMTYLNEEESYRLNPWVNNWLVPQISASDKGKHPVVTMKKFNHEFKEYRAFMKLNNKLLKKQDKKAYKILK